MSKIRRRDIDEFFFFQPLVGTFLGWLILGEVVGTSTKSDRQPLSLFVTQNYWTKWQEFNSNSQ